MNPLYIVETYINGNKKHARDEYYKLDADDRQDTLKNAFYESKECNNIDFLEFVLFLAGHTN
jgi:hypothetical protein